METHDPSLHRRSTDKLKTHSAAFDEASGLAQRALFRQRCEQAWEWAQREQLPASALFVHIDGYQAYQTRHGQPAADRLIYAVAEAIRRSCRRRADFAGRLRVDEFGISLTDVGQKGTRHLAEQILSHAATPALEAAGVAQAATVGIRIGAACQIPPTHKFAQSLLVATDEALARAIRAGDAAPVQTSFDTPDA